MSLYKIGAEQPQPQKGQLGVKLAVIAGGLGLILLAPKLKRKKL